LFRLETARSDIRERLRQAARSGKHGIYKCRDSLIMSPYELV
jgi:hypothetical protein